LLLDLLHQEIVDEVEACNTGIVEETFNFVEVVSGQALARTVLGLVLPIWALRVQKHAILVSFQTESVQVLNAGNVLLKEIQLVHLLQLLHRKS
jgi:hypothetical protein